MIDSRLHSGLHGNAGAVASLPQQLATGQVMPGQLVSQASLWELEQRFAAHGLEPAAAYDERAMQAPFDTHTNAWIALAANALALCVANGVAFVDPEAVVLDGSFCRPLLQKLIEHTARALDGAWLPLHANYAPDRELFLKVEA